MDLTRLDLPLAPHLPDIGAALGEHRLLVLHAEPGAGKSTLVPPYLLDAPWLAGKSMVMLEPRRVAAVAVATRIAELLGEGVGRRAGYRVRSASAVGPATRIEVVTEALLTRKIQADPLLDGVGLVAFDEYHERSIHADLALALSLEVRRARPDLAILLMSATLEAERIVAFLGTATGAAPPLLSVPGRMHPVRTEYRAPPSRGPWEPAFAGLVEDVAARSDGTVLAFLPGMREIRRVAGAIGRVQVETLHGSMPLEEQRRVLAPPAPGGDSRRAILATSVAETSLTVPGVRAVVDSGWARTSRYHPSTGMDRLETERVSSSSAEQRRGRAGRLGPGWCIRFWSESEKLLAAPEPEILRTDLASLVLECAVWGARSPDSLAWLDPPPRSSWDTAVELLRFLRYLDAEGSPTRSGRRAVELGLHPRLAALLGEGETDAGSIGLATACAALLTERDGSGLRGEPDFRLRLAMLRSGGGGSGDTASAAWRSAVRGERERIVRLARLQASGWDESAEEEVGKILVRGFPDRVARRGADGLWRFPSGRAAKLPDGPGLAPLRRAPDTREEREAWLVAPEVDAGESVGTVRLAVPISRETAHQALEPVTRISTEVRWEGLRGRGIRLRAAGRLTLEERPAKIEHGVLVSAFLERLRSEGTGFLPWEDRARRVLARLRFHARRGGELSVPLPEPGELSDAALVATAGDWLAGWIDTSGGPALSADRLRSALESLVQSRSVLARSAPESIALPTGQSRKVDYSAGEPAVEARIQEVFGLTASPLVGGVPLIFRLLSPAGRPLQVTRDLASFWRNTYPEVRKEMRGRYPRHYWPESPLEAEPTVRAKPRGGHGLR